MLEQYITETFNLSHGWGSVDYHVYSGKDLGMPDLPKIPSNWNDDHADLVAMFTGK
jgi:hypothetical protein